MQMHYGDTNAFADTDTDTDTDGGAGLGPWSPLQKGAVAHISKLLTNKLNVGPAL